MRRRLGLIIGYCSDTVTRSLVATVSCFVVAGATEFVIHQTLRRGRMSPFVDAMLDATIVGLCFSIVLWVLSAGNRDRRRRVREELARIAELNHEIRNALQVITHTQYVNSDFEHRQAILDSVTRIDAVLKRVFRIVGGR